MKSKNYSIISLYFSVFLIISLLTAYFPLWLNKTLSLDPIYIGYILSVAGIFKALFTILLSLNIKKNNYLRSFLLCLVIFKVFLIFLIYILQNYYLSKITLFISLIFIISFSPTLPLIETLYSDLVKKSEKKNYGKIRISGSISFCLGVFIFGYFINIHSINIFPIIMIFCLTLLTISILTIPKNLKKIFFYNFENFRTLLKKKTVIIYFILICSLIQGTHAMYYGYSTIVWQNKSLNFFDIGILWSLAIFSEILIFMYIGNFFKPIYLQNTLIFCCVVTSFRWLFTYFVENFYLLCMIQTLHGVTFALTHYIMIYFINLKLKEDLHIYAQTIYYSITGGFFITIFTISCGYILSYFNSDEGYLLMSSFAFLSFIFLLYRKKIHD